VREREREVTIIMAMLKWNMITYRHYKKKGVNDFCKNQGRNKTLIFLYLAVRVFIVLTKL